MVNKSAGGICKLTIFHFMKNNTKKVCNAPVKKNKMGPLNKFEIHLIKKRNEYITTYSKECLTSGVDANNFLKVTELMC